MNECGICLDPYDKTKKVRRFLDCMHNFCETCLNKLFDESSLIVCPNCRKVTSNITDIKNLPTEFQKSISRRDLELELEETSASLSKDSSALTEVIKEFQNYLSDILKINSEASISIKRNYELEYTKIQTAYLSIINLIETYKNQLQSRILQSYIIQQSKILKANNEINQKIRISKILEQRLQDLMKKIEEKELLKLDRKFIFDHKREFVCIQKDLEQAIKINPISSIQLSEHQINISKLSSIFNIISPLDPRVLDISKPFLNQKLYEFSMKISKVKQSTIVAFSKSKVSSECIISKYNIITGLFNHKNLLIPNDFDLSQIECITHPSMNSIFLIAGDKLLLFDNLNNIFIKKPSCADLNGVTKYCSTFVDNCIYIMGGLRQGMPLSTCNKFCIITEKWWQVSNMITPRFHASSCAINDFQMIVVGGENLTNLFLDSIEIYNCQQNEWEVLQIKISFPAKNLAVVPIEKDRILIMGGEASNKTSLRPEEIDLVKLTKSNIPVPNLNFSRWKALPLSQNIYLFGVNNPEVIGERFTISENKWNILYNISKKQNAFMVSNSYAIINE